MKAKSFKRFTALLVAVMLIVSMCVTCISASAAAVSDGTRVVYLKPNTNWEMDSARFAIYLFGDGTTWADMADEDGDGYYSVTIPAGNWTNIIFCRMDPSSTENSWDTKWNQTTDLEIPDDANCYVVESGTWDKGNGEWIAFNPDNPPEETTAPTTESKPVIVGDPDSFYLFGFIEGANYACEEDSDNAGIYKFTDNTLVATFAKESYVAVKKGDNSAWYMTNGWLGESVTSATLYNTNVIDSDANKLYVPSGTYTFTLVDNGDDTFTLSYTKNGDTDPTGTTEPTEEPAPTDPVVTDYYLFGTINDANYGCEEDYQNLGEYKFVDGKVTATFEVDSYVAVKTGDNANWYMTDGWMGFDVTSATLYSTSVLDSNADKLYVPANKTVEFTLVDNGDGTFNLSYVVISEPETTAPETEVSTGEPTEAPTTAPVTEAPTTVDAPYLTVNATSNLFGSATAKYNNETNQVVVSYYMDCDKNIENFQFVLTFDPEVLTLNSSNNKVKCYPSFYQGIGCELNLEKDYYIKGNGSNTGTWEISSATPFFTVTFDVNDISAVAPVTTAIDLQLEYMLIGNAVDYVVDTSTEERLATDSVIDWDVYSNNNITTTTVLTESTYVPVEPTEAPTTAPVTTEPVDGVELYFAAPVFKEGTSWDDIYFTYSASSNLSSATKIPMVKTDNMYYASGTLAGSLSTNSNWAVYKVTLTDEQAAAIDAANYSGFTSASNLIRTNYIWANSVLRANVDSTGYKGSNTPVADLNGKMFVISDATSLANKTTFLGNWVSQTGSPVTSTIYAASPVVNDTTSMGDVYFRYGSTSTVSAATQIRMLETDYLYTNSVSASNLMEGDWTVYKLDVTAEQEQAINAANYTGFTSSYGAEIRTSFTYANSVTRAKVGSYSATYNGASTPLADLNGKMFVIQGSVSSSTTSYLGYWSDYNVTIKTVTFKVAVPNVVNKKAVTSLDLMYSDDFDVNTATRIAMTKTDEAFTPDAVYTDVIGSTTDWAIYTVTVDANQIKEIESSYRVGFIANDQVLKTDYSWSGNVLRAGIGAYETPYDTTTTATVASVEGATFVVCGASNNNTLIMRGYWKLP